MFYYIYLMRVQVVSNINIHTKLIMPNIRSIITPKADVLLLAGNICFIKHKFFVPFFQKLSTLFKKVIYVFGPNEYFYEDDLNMESFAEMELLAKDSLKPFPNIHILQKSYIILDKVVFIGSTLWSYLSKKDLISKSKSLSKTMFIRYQDKILIDPIITNKIHFKHKEWLEEMLRIFNTHKVIALTYHLPTFLALDEPYNLLSKGNYSNNDHLVLKSSAWCAGAGDCQKIIHVGKTPVYMNPWEATTPNLVFLV